jgi:hypothetical protein
MNKKVKTLILRKPTIKIIKGSFTSVWSGGTVMAVAV